MLNDKGKFPVAEVDDLYMVAPTKPTAQDNIGTLSSVDVNTDINMLLDDAVQLGNVTGQDGVMVIKSFIEITPVVLDFKEPPQEGN